jgi:Inositol monophosphatase family
MVVDPSDVAIAHELATIAAEVALPYVSDAVDHSLKSDGSPVSACDLAVERALIEFLRHYRPNDGILSEELGEVALGERRWLLDPIDGTSQFVSGGTEWGTHWPSRSTLRSCSASLRARCNADAGGASWMMVPMLTMTARQTLDPHA